MPFPTRTAVPRGRGGRVLADQQKAGGRALPALTPRRPAHLLLFDLAFDRGRESAGRGAPAEPARLARRARPGRDRCRGCCRRPAPRRRPRRPPRPRRGRGGEAAPPSRRAGARRQTGPGRPFGGRRLVPLERVVRERELREAAPGSRPRDTPAPNASTSGRPGRASARRGRRGGARPRQRAADAAPARGRTSVHARRARARRTTSFSLPRNPEARTAARSAGAIDARSAPATGPTDSCRNATRTAEAPRGGESVRSNSHGASYDNRAAGCANFTAPMTTITETHLSERAPLPPRQGPRALRSRRLATPRRERPDLGLRRASSPPGYPTRARS